MKPSTPTCALIRALPLFRNRLARTGFVRIRPAKDPPFHVTGHLDFLGLCPRHIFETWVKLDRSRSDLVQDVCVTFNSCSAVAICASSVFAISVAGLIYSLRR